MPPLLRLVVAFYCDDFSVLVRAASSARPMGHTIRIALGADCDVGRFQLPVGAAPFVSSLSRYLTFWDCHTDTSLALLRAALCNLFQ